MRVFFNMSKTTFPKGGRNDHIVYCYHNDGMVCIGRKYLEIPFMPQNAELIKMEKITLAIWKHLPQRVKKDFFIYAKAYIREYPKIRRKFLNSYSIFLKVIHKIEGECHLSKQQNVGFDLYKRLFGAYSVYDFIKLGFLLPIKNGYKLRSKILVNVHKEDNIYSAILLDNIDLIEEFSSKRAYG